MLKKRIIPCLDIKNGRTVKGIKFLDLLDAGDPVELAEMYVQQGADELVLLDITATLDGRSAMKDVVESVAQRINIPFTVGGGIRSVQDAKELIALGADKVSVNSAAIRRPELIREIADRFGRQAVVVAIDIKLEAGEAVVYGDAGTIRKEMKALDWAKEVVEQGAGELLLTVMDKDGTKSGFATELIEEINREVSVPVIASGGAGGIVDFIDLFQTTDISAGLAASIFHFGEVNIRSLKNQLKERQIPVR